MQTDCEVFQDAAAYIGQWLTVQPSVKEESLTDWLLFDISTKVSRIVYTCFSRHDEARKTGADWEWWFVYTNGSYRYRVQAKKTKKTGDNYPSIAYKNKHGLQIDKLLANSKDVNAVPVYVFFTASTTLQNSKCGRRIQSTGAFSVGAQTIYDRYIVPGKSKVSENDLLVQSIPLECYTCCPLMHETPRGMDEFLSRYFLTELKLATNASKESSLGFHPELPAYAASLLEHRDGIPAWWEQDFQSQISDFDSIVIYDRRNIT